MRTYLITLALIFMLGVPAVAFEIEEDRLFPGAGQELRILSTTDTVIFSPLIEGFQKTRPDLAVRYTVASSQEVFRAIYDEGAQFDLVISSAMDLQMKLANDGFAASFSSAATQALPRWAFWRDQLYAFTQEPVVMIASRHAFEGLVMPRTRQDLIRVLRDNPDRFRGRIGTYDPQVSGAGYLFATQDTRQSDTFWRLAEVMGALAPRLYASTGTMIDQLRDGDLALAYNVLGSYANARLPEGGDGVVVELEDFTLTLLRTALVPQNAANPKLGGAFLDYLLSGEGRRLIRDEAGLPPIDESALAAGQHLRPIRLDPGLLVFADPLKRQRFLREWSGALIHP